MQVELISHTPDALELLIFTKGTRLQGQQTMEDIKALPMENKLAELAYMRDTIKSSWEFVDYTFLITGVSRAFTHQLVRTRTASYAQESQRAVDARDAGYLALPVGKYSKDVVETYDILMRGQANAYSNMMDKHSMDPQDARGLLPTTTLTSIIMKASLRTLHEMAELRLCTRTQGEYQDVFRLMRAAVIAVHPWAEDFIEVFCVNHGTCAFPRYDKCPIKSLTFQPSKENLSAIKQKWQTDRHEAATKAKNGRSM